MRISDWISDLCSSDLLARLDLQFLQQGVERLGVGGVVQVLDDRWRDAAILQQRQGLPRLAEARVVIDGDGHRPSSSSMPCCWPPEGAACSRSSRAPRTLPLTNFHASWGPSETMLNNPWLFLCRSGGRRDEKEWVS